MFEQRPLMQTLRYTRQSEKLRVCSVTRASGGRLGSATAGVRVPSKY
jgi:hypothetical protein